MCRLQRHRQTQAQRSEGAGWPRTGCWIMCSWARGRLAAAMTLRHSRAPWQFAALRRGVITRGDGDTPAQASARRWPRDPEKSLEGCCFSRRARTLHRRAAQTRCSEQAACMRCCCSSRRRGPLSPAPARPLTTSGLAGTRRLPPRRRAWQPWTDSRILYCGAACNARGGSANRR